jgi:putative transposase
MRTGTVTTATKKALRDYAVNSNALDARGHSWAKDIPYEIRDGAMLDFVKARATVYAKTAKNKQKKSLSYFNFKYRRDKDTLQTIQVLGAKSWNKNRGVYASVFGPNVLAAECELPVAIKDSRLIRTRTGDYYICIPIDLVQKSENQAPFDLSHGVISCDPGVRTFMTCYDADGSLFEWGVNDVGTVLSLCRQHDKIQCRLRTAGLHHNTRRTMRKRALKKLEKVRDLVADIHRKLCVWLCENYRCIILPKFESANMVKRSKRRKMNGKTAKTMLTFSHFLFRQRLLHKVREYPWCRVFLCDESFTSKTCGNCGLCNDKLGGSKLFHCKSCNFRADRDANGARNILIKYLVEKT